MDNLKFSNKIQELVAKDQLDLAIIELSKIASGSQKLNAIILQSATLFDIKRQIRNGTVAFEKVNHQKNKVRLALLELAQEIHLMNDRQLNSEISQVQKWNDLEEVISIVKMLYETVNSILINNQRILSPIFTKNYDREKLEEEMILLYHNQKNRGNFSRWKYYLKNKFGTHKSFGDLETNFEIDSVIVALEKLHFILYSPVEKDLDFKMIINKRLDNLERWNSKPIMFLVLDKENDIPIPTIREIIDKYLNSLRDITEQLGESLGYLLSLDKK